MNENNFGEILKHNYLLDSLILTDNEAQTLIEMTKLKSENFNLIYRATKDGFVGQAFHLKCDGKRNTICIIKSSSNYVFGGYTSTAWQSTNVHLTDENAFIFSLRRDGESKADKFMVKNPVQAIRGQATYGPTFGAYDIYVCNQPNINVGGYTNFGSSYHLPEGLICGSENAKTFLSGNYDKWLAEEIEVYEIQ